MNFTCPICLDDIVNFNNKKTLSCEHMFHKECIKLYFDTNLFINECPVCKNKVNIKNIKLDNNNIIICPYYEKNIENEFQKVILRKNDLFHKLLKFFNFTEIHTLYQLLNKNVIISGSLMLSTIMNTQYENSDLDIYIDNESDYHRMIRFILSINYKPVNEDELDNYKYIQPYNNSSNKYDMPFISCVNTFINKSNENIKIDIIYNLNNKKLLIEFFDLDIVKNYFDGSNIYIYNVTKLLYKIDLIHYCKLDEKREKRIIKYRNRGFTIDIVYY